MPEYLSPGVFVEEVPPRLRAIEGVSTSTAGFVGVAERGPVAGFPLPFKDIPGFPLDPETGLVLVTSYAEFTRTFGPPLPVPRDTDDRDRGYLGHAVRAFFDNGGKRVYVARVAHFVAPPPAPAAADANNAARSRAQLKQGVRARLVRGAKVGDTVLSLDTVAGLGTAGVFVRRRADDTGALDPAAGPAVITGAGTATAPYNLAPNDAFTVSVTDGGPPINTIIAVAAGLPKRAEFVFGNATFNLAANDTLKARVGAAGGPDQTVTFATGFTAGAATPAEVAAIFNAQLTGVQAEVVGGKLVLRSDLAGPNARLEVVAGPRASEFDGAAVKTGAGGVADLTRVTIAGLAALAPDPSVAKFTIDSDGANHLRITSTAVGTGVTVQVTSTVAGLLAKLGLPAAPTGSGTGTPGADTLQAVALVDAAKKTITLSAPLKIALDPDAVSVAPATPPLADKGPTFHARSPGTWGDAVSVVVRPSDRAPVRLSADAPAGTALGVASAAGFYDGAVVELLTTTARPDGVVEVVAAEPNVVARVSGNTLTLGTALAAPRAAATTRVRLLELDVVVTDESGTAPTETYTGLSWNRGTSAASARRHYATQINRRSRLVYAEPPAAADEATDLTGLPTTPNGFPLRLTGGADGFPAAGADGDPDYVGDDGGPGRRTGLQALRDTDEVRILAAPGKATFAVHSALITQCEQLKYRFAVLDGENRPQLSVADILTHRNIYDTSYAAYYTPWLDVPAGDQTLRLPPSGFVVGIYARTDVERGVQKAPANELVRGPSAPAVSVTTGEQDVLNPRGVNAIRRFEGRGIRVWGARTLSSDAAVKYVNVRRSLIFLGASIDRAMQTVVFEPNAPDTWGRVTDSVRAFLHTQWRAGLLLGRRPEDAFSARCDESTMTADDVQNGRLICEIGVAIVRPAEFVIFRIEQLTGFAKQV